MKVQLGCGNNYKQGWVNIDLDPRVKADERFDLNKGLPFPDNCVEELEAHHVIEHLDDIFFIMREIHRVVKPEGIVRITVPHWQNPWAFGDPSHKHYFNEFTFDTFVKGATGRVLQIDFFFEKISQTMNSTKEINVCLKPSKGEEMLEFMSIAGHLTKQEGIQLYQLAKTLEPDVTVVELGSWKGKSTVAILQGLRSGKMYCVDTFENNNMMNAALTGSTLQEFKNNTKKYIDKVIILIGLTNVCSREFTSPIDLLFIDGDHSKKGVLDDIANWTPYLKENAWLIFHDYANPGPGGIFGVTQAITESGIDKRLTDIFRIGMLYGGRFHKKGE